jgi:hypothetical protein
VRGPRAGHLQRQLPDSRGHSLEVAAKTPAHRPAWPYGCCSSPIFQAGHEGSIPFARSNPKPQVSVLDGRKLGLTRCQPRFVPHTCHTASGSCLSSRSSGVAPACADRTSRTRSPTASAIALSRSRVALTLGIPSPETSRIPPVSPAANRRCGWGHPDSSRRRCGLGRGRAVHQANLGASADRRRHRSSARSARRHSRRTRTGP